MHRNRTRARTPQVHDVAERYGLKVVSWESHDSLYRVGAAIHVSTKNGSMLIKPFHGTKVALREMTIRMEELWERGYRRMPKLRRSLTGAHYVEVRGQRYYATNWVVGELLEATPSSLSRLGSALAELHLVPARIRFSHEAMDQPKLARFRKYDQNFRNHPASVTHREPLPRVWFRETTPEFVRLSDEAWQRLESPELTRVMEREWQDLPLVHGDVTRFNVVVSPQGSVKLIDWDRVGVGSGWLELVTALCNTTNFSPVEMDALLHGYERIRPLSRRERRFIAALYRLPREVWYARHMSGDAQVWNDDLVQVLMRTWADRLRAAQWLDMWAEGR